MPSELNVAAADGPTTPRWSVNGLPVVVGHMTSD